MKYQELKVDTTYTVDNKKFKVLFKHDESKTAFILDVEENKTSQWDEEELLFLEQKLPNIGLLRGSNENFIYRTDVTSGYGFDSCGKFRTSFSCRFDNGNWKEATKEDHAKFKELVIDHLKSLGFNNRDSFVGLSVGSYFTIDFHASIIFGSNGISLGRNYVYRENKWIQPISVKNKLKKEIETRLEKILKELQQLKKDIAE